jgi:uncharacterized membrane protein YccC
MPPLRQTLDLAAMFLAGSLWALLLTMVIWRLYPYRPARRAVGYVYRELARLSDDLLRLLDSGGAGEAEWDRHARLHRRQVRDAIERARDAVLQTVRMRGPVSGYAAQSWVRLEAADQMFAALIALSDRLGQGVAPEAASRASRMLRLLRPVLLLLERAVVADTRAKRPGLERAIAVLRHVGAAPPGAAPDTVAEIAAALSDRLRIASTLSGADAWLPERAEAAPGRIWAVVEANMHWESDVLRHSLRIGFLGGLAFAVTRHWPGPYVHWFTITLLLTMQPYFALTFTRAVERVGGTVLGGLLAAALATVATTPIVIAVALFPLAVVALSMRAVSFGLFMACLTPLVVLLSELGRPGTSEVTIALARAGFTIAGGALALVGAWALWPTWEPARVRGQVTQSIVAHASYAAAEIAVLLGQAKPETAERARRAAGLASNALEASLQRALLEPRRGSAAARLEAALTIDAALRRVAGRLTAVHVSGGPPAMTDRVAWGRWRDFFTAVVEAARGERLTLPPRPELPRDAADADALSRLAAQFELIAGAAARLATEAGR